MELKASINRILLIILCILPFVFTHNLWDTYYLGKAIILFFLTTLILFKWILYEREKRAQFQALHVVSKFAVVFLALLILSMFFTEDVGHSILGHENRWNALIIIMCYGLLLIFSFFYFELSDRTVHLVLGSGLVMGLIGLLQFLRILKYSFYNFPFNDTFHRAFGTLGNPNFMGHYLVIMLSISVYYYFQKQNNWYLIGSGFLYAILLTTNTRGAWLGGTIALGILMVHTAVKTKQFKKILILSGLFVLITVTLDVVLHGVLILRFLTILFEFGDLLGPGPVDPSGGSYRIALWLEGLAAIPQKPLFGVGISNYRLILERSLTPDVVIMADPHNDYLTYAATAGIPSAVAYAGMIFSGIILSYKRLR